MKLDIKNFLTLRTKMALTEKVLNAKFDCMYMIVVCLFVEGVTASQTGLHKEAKASPYAKSATGRSRNHSWQPVLDVFLTPLPSRQCWTWR